MTNPIIETIQATADNIYAVCKNRLTGQTWNTVTPGWENFNAANWADYAIALTQDGSTGYFWTARPAGQVGSLVTDVFYVRAGADPATTDAPPYNLVHNLGENLAAIYGDAVNAPANLQAGTGLSQIAGAVAAGTITNTSFPTNLGDLTNNLIANRTLYFTSGALKGSAVAVLGYVGSTGVITVSPLVGAPSANDTFLIS